MYTFFCTSAVVVLVEGSILTMTMTKRSHLAKHHNWLILRILRTSS